MNCTAEAETIPFLPSPPLAPLTPEQERFMWLHAFHNVVRWQWTMQESQLRAFAVDGVAATISSVDLDDLVARGLAIRGRGCADVLLTDLGLTASTVTGAGQFTGLQRRV